MLKALCRLLSPLCWIMVGSLSSISTWTDPSGSAWSIDYKAPLIVDQVKEVLTETFTQHVWKHQAAKHFAGIGVRPDLTAYSRLKRTLKQESDHRRLYFLDAVVQGSAGNLAEQAIHLKDGLPTCSLCSRVVTGCPFYHYCYDCISVLNASLKGVEASEHHVEQAKAEALIRPHL